MIYFFSIFTVSVTLFIGVGSFFFKYLKKFCFFPCFFCCCKKKKSNNSSLQYQRNPLPTEPSNIDESQSENKKCYQKKLQEFAIGTLQFKTHFYDASAKKNTSINSTKVKRLTTEIKQLSNSLPIYFSNAIFVRYDENKMDMMKAIIMGADDTPYAHGAFLYDIYFEDTYPTTPPKVNLMTTGGGKIRFNPNLYNTGYVCLSLIGTWSGGKGETWTPNSNILQVLLSIQSLVMTEDVIYNEPSYVCGKKNLSYQRQDIGYKNIVKYGNVKYAMLEMLKNPPPGFEDVINQHFYYKREEIQATCDKWVDEAVATKESADYTGLVVSHNYELATLFSKNKDNYCKEFTKVVNELKEKLMSLNI